MAVDFDYTASSISKGEKGIKLQRVATVTGLTGNANTRLYNALNDASMPDIGDTHPVIPNVTVQDITGRVIDPETVQVTITYFEDPGSATTQATAALSAAGGSVQEETKFDAYGVPLLAYFNKTTNWEYKATAQVSKTRLSIDFTYTAATYPRAEIEAYTNRVNDADWNGYAPKTVLCASIDAQPTTGTDYRVRFTFVYEPETWQFEQRIFTFTLPLSAHTTIPDSLIDLTTGKKNHDVYLPVDFSALGFDIGGVYAVMSGTVISAPPTEANIVAGAKTIILDLTGDTWVTAGATFDAERAGILAGLTAGTYPTGINAVGWNALTFAVTSVVRTSSTKVTITLPAAGTYSITRSETVNCVIPASALTTSTTPLIVSQRFKIQAA